MQEGGEGDEKESVGLEGKNVSRGEKGELCVVLRCSLP